MSSGAGVGAAIRAYGQLETPAVAAR